MSGNQLYQHPDGPSIDLLDGMLTVTDSDGQTTSVPVGEIGLTELGERMVSIGQALTTGRSTTEQAGYGKATDARTVYSHPDGFTLDFCDHTLIATDDDGRTVPLPIGAVGLKELGHALLALAAEQDDEFASERAGAAMGGDLVDELFALRGRPQAEAFRALHDKLYALSKLEHFDSAAGGFAGAVVNVLEIGIANIPQFEREDC